MIETESATPAEEKVVQTTDVSSIKKSRSFDILKSVFEQPASDFDHLFENNRAWVDACVQSDPEFFEKIASGQASKILFIGRADSRVSAQEILGLKPGEAFIHRNVANLVVNGDSYEYACRPSVCCGVSQRRRYHRLLIHGLQLY